MTTTPAASGEGGPREVKQPPVARTVGLRVYVANLAALIAVGVAISWWLLEFTDFFPAVGGLLGLSGIFAWVAVVTNLITDDRKKELQAQLERVVLGGFFTLTVAVLVLIGVGFWYAFHGAVVIAANGRGEKRVVEIFEGSTRLARLTGVDGSTTHKVPLFVRGFRFVTVRTEGLPALAVKVEPRRKTEVVVPVSFYRQPVVLTHGSLDFGKVGKRVKVLLNRGGGWQHFSTVEPYFGQGIWIGAAADTEVPPVVRERWARLGLEQTIDPTSAGPQLLQAGDEVRVCVENDLGAVAAWANTKVLADGQRPFPQEMQLEAPPQEAVCQ